MKCGGQDPGVQTTFVVDLNGANPDNPPGWIVAGNMHRARRNHNLVILPDGKVLAVGGNTHDYFTGPVFEAEIFDPASGTWSLQPPSDPGEPRGYHSTALLLRDGRVVSAGGDGRATAQIFKPPYITSGAPRPSITGAPLFMQYAQPYTVSFDPNGAQNVNRTCLIKLGATTHGFDQDQRYIPLNVVTETAPGTLEIQAPPNANIAPPGFYMLFILNEYTLNQFAPCQLAAYVHVGP